MADGAAGTAGDRHLRRREPAARGSGAGRGRGAGQAGASRRAGRLRAQGGPQRGHGALIIGSQEWSDLLFIHWRVAASDLRRHVHDRLSIDERDGSAWISMTPFTLRRGRLRGLPALPDFHELNFRTYVTLSGQPGIWFFSLDAANLLAVAAARLTVRLPYFPARMDRGPGWYRSERRTGQGSFQARWSEGAELGSAVEG